MNKTSSQNPEQKVAEKAVAANPPIASATTAVKARTVARRASGTAKRPVAAKSKPSKPVATAPMPASRAPSKARAGVTPAATAKPKSAPVEADNVLSGTKVPAKARTTKALAEAVTPAPSKSKPLSEAKKAKETKHLGKKSKLIRDSFTFPSADYALIALLKQRALKAGHEVKKSELLRTGLRVLAALPEATLVKALGSIDRLKPGRPSK